MRTAELSIASIDPVQDDGETQVMIKGENDVAFDDDHDREELCDWPPDGYESSVISFRPQKSKDHAAAVEGLVVIEVCR